MSTLKLQAKYENRIITRRNPATGSEIRIDTSTADPSTYHKYAKVGFDDIFEEVKEQPTKVETKKITVQVDNLNDLNYKELKEQATAKGLKFPANIKKVDLIELINGKA